MNNLIGLIIDKANLQLPGRVKFDIVVKGECELTREKAKHTLTLIEADLIEAELLAPLKEENARLKEDRANLLTWRKEEIDKNARLTALVADAKETMMEIIDGFHSDTYGRQLLWQCVTRLPAATAPADAEQQAGETQEEAEDADGEQQLWADVVERFDEIHQRLDEHGRRLDLLNEAGGAYVTALHATNRRLDELAARVDETDKKATDAQARIRGVEKKVSQQGNEISTHRAQFGAIKRGILKHSANFGTAMSEIFPRLTVLEAARQQTPQPTPSAPVVTKEAAIKIAQDTYRSLIQRGNSDMRAVERAVTAAFAARDAEEAAR